MTPGASVAVGVGFVPTTLVEVEPEPLLAASDVGVGVVLLGLPLQDVKMIATSRSGMARMNHCAGNRLVGFFMIQHLLSSLRTLIDIKHIAALSPSRQ